MSPEHEIPLAVDLDGTLVQGDTLYELLFAALRRRPLLVLLLPVWLLSGKAALKARLAEATDPKSLKLLFHAPVLDWLRAQKDSGRTLVLATAADRRVADAAAAETGLFDAVMATEDGRNLRGQAKADALVERFGARGFDYAGNDAHDLPVWRVARQAVVVAPQGAAIVRRAAEANPNLLHIAVPGASARAVLKEMRLHQWAKNALVFVPLVAAHRFTELPLLLHAAIAFLAMGLVASAGYIANDLLDLQADRGHPRKCRRPFAGGLLPVPLGPPIAGALLLGGVALAASVSWALVLWVLLYLALTLTYSFWLKQKVLADVFVLAGLYTHRILAGAIAHRHRALVLAAGALDVLLPQPGDAEALFGTDRPGRRRPRRAPGQGPRLPGRGPGHAGQPRFGQRLFLGLRAGALHRQPERAGAVQDAGAVLAVLPLAAVLAEPHVGRRPARRDRRRPAGLRAARKEKPADPGGDAAAGGAQHDGRFPLPAARPLRVSFFHPRPSTLRTTPLPCANPQPKNPGRASSTQARSWLPVARLCL
jgi:hypothetical protein